ncbi:hypothetical protein ACJA23_00465 [Mycoplasma corogypsi]|uniref:hypothetical protein n=1 Tax=Mycoplasma corogypsi TaxID=2106 RepID=UPI0038739E3B
MYLIKDLIGLLDDFLANTKAKKSVDSIISTKYLFIHNQVNQLKIINAATFLSIIKLLKVKIKIIVGKDLNKIQITLLIHGISLYLYSLGTLKIDVKKAIITPKKLADKVISIVIHKYFKFISHKLRPGKSGSVLWKLKISLKILIVLSKFGLVKSKKPKL